MGQVLGDECLVVVVIAKLNSLIYCIPSCSNFLEQSQSLTETVATAPAARERRHNDSFRRETQIRSLESAANAKAQRSLPIEDAITNAKCSPMADGRALECTDRGTILSIRH
ncbi:hypothetical protein KIN20_015045 [Parelaphostrongylus tenuis]|uniref:Uncharacterized protein n=1 Tax=Parelaphostrongylus tenuis TaxID=148309 RepID=A0AAD5QLZ6_PARTN|nr:hypothetical protein KIN20_015045 [Parelaphostrongylus tenuis]